jgi:hypothetical protein
MMAQIGRDAFLLTILSAFSSAASGQNYDISMPAGGPFSRSLMNAPFSADATTLLTMHLPYEAGATARSVDGARL